MNMADRADNPSCLVNRTNSLSAGRALVDRICRLLVKELSRGRQGFGRQVFSRQGFGTQVFSRQGFGRQVFSRQGFGRQVFSRQSFGRQVFSRQGFTRGALECSAHVVVA